MTILSSSGRSKIISSYAAWWLLWIAIETLIMHQLGFDWNVSMTDAAITQAALALSGYTVNTTMRFYQPKQIVRTILAWSIAMAVFAGFAQKWILSYVLSRHDDYLLFLNKSLFIREAFDWLMISFITLTSWLWFYVLEHQENEKQLENTERLAREAELSDLRNQLQPHFLFNSLNSISALIVTRPEQARTMIQQLSDFLRGTVRKDNRQFVSLEEELRHLQLYLEIEKIRFGHRLNTVISHDEASLSGKIPSLLLQPIVENAIKFGLYDTVGDITISIVARADNHSLTVEIKNPFDAETAAPKKGTGFGLNSVRRRLYLLYSQNDLLLTSQTSNEFSTTLIIPQLA